MSRRPRKTVVAVALALVCASLTSAPSQAALVNGCNPEGSSFSGILGDNLFGGGEGRSNAPWLICTRAQLEKIANSNVPANSHFKLATDIDLGPKNDPSKNWTPILAANFQGSFDGSYFAIKNMYVTGVRTQYGFFSTLGPATVKNIQFVDAEINSSATASEEGGSGTLPSGGIVAASNNSSTLTNILITRPVLQGNLRSAAFVVGESYWAAGSGTTATYKYIKVVDGSISTTHDSSSKPQLAGIVGITRGAIIHRVSLEGEIVGLSTGAKMAGLVAWGSFGAVNITETYVDIDINANAINNSNFRIGGFVGESSQATIRDSYYVGEITNALTSYVGGIGGYMSILPQRVYVLEPIQYSATITNRGQLVGGPLTKNDDSTSVFYLKDTADERFSNTYGFPTRKTDAELKTESTFESTGWLIGDTVTDAAEVSTNWVLDPDPAIPNQKIWKITSGSSYPRLIWLDFWPKTVVNAPTSPIASSTEPETATLGWTAATSSGFNSAVTGYKIESSIDNGATWTTVVADTGNVTSRTISTLAPASSYIFRVSALAGNLTSTPSTATTSIAVAASTPPSYSGPLISRFSNSRLLADQPTRVTARGERLGQIEAATIDGLVVRILRKSSEVLELELPALSPGLKTLRLVSSSGVLLHQDAFLVTTLGSGNELSNKSGERRISFMGNRFTISAAARKDLADQIRQTDNISKVVCIGSTSGRRVTAFDKRLALRRAQAVCDLVQAVRPALQTEVLTNPSSGVGSRFRSVTVQFSSN